MTTVWGLSLDTIEQYITPLREGGNQRERRDAFAAAAWSFLVEPGDRVAGWLMRTMGAASALTALLDRTSPTQWGDGEVSADEIADAQARWEPRCDSSAFLRALSVAASVKAQLVVPGDDVWPQGLDDLGDNAPVALWVRGSVSALPHPSHSVAIVGARASTGYGEHIAMELSANLARNQISVVSGGAYGIDGVAHRAALASEGSTIAILAGGIDRLYPAGHDELLRRIGECGALVSEVSPGSAPTRWRFLQRNRLIAAMSGATVVVEAGYRSGSLNTAGHARELDRPLGVFPGPVTSASSAGCHRLLRDNPAATLVTGFADVVELLTGTIVGQESWSEDSDETTRVIDSLSVSRTRTVEQIAASSGVPVARVMSCLGLLDVSGRVTRRGAEWALVAARS